METNLDVICGVFADISGADKALFKGIILHGIATGRVVDAGPLNEVCPNPVWLRQALLADRRNIETWAANGVTQAQAQAAHQRAAFIAKWN